LVVRRPKYACRTCEDVVVQASAPPWLIEGGLPTEATVAQVLVSKYADHLPLYRQAQIYARQGVNLDRSTLADWVGRAAFLLRPVYQRLLDRLRASSKLFADETTAPVLDPGRRRTKTGQLFAYARDDRPWGGTEPELSSPNPPELREVIQDSQRKTAIRARMPTGFYSPRGLIAKPHAQRHLCFSRSSLVSVAESDPRGFEAARIPEDLRMMAGSKRRHLPEAL
jgi:hypothetical protein